MCVCVYRYIYTGFPCDSAVKNLPAMQEKRVQSLSWEDPLEEEMATHSSILAWRIPWTKEPGRLQSIGLQKKSHMTETPEHAHTYIYKHMHTHLAS